MCTLYFQMNGPASSTKGTVCMMKKTDLVNECMALDNVQLQSCVSAMMARKSGVYTDFHSHNYVPAIYSLLYINYMPDHFPSITLKPYMYIMQCHSVFLKPCPLPPPKCHWPELILATGVVGRGRRSLSPSHHFCSQYQPQPINQVVCLLRN